jgi:hypothetical protein
MSTVIYGIGGYRPAHPSQGRILFADDLTSTVTTWNEAGAQTGTRPYTVDEQAAASAAAIEQTAQLNRVTIEQRAQTALAANETFLAIASPSNAQNAAQIKLLTRECQGLIRLAIKALDSLNGT